MRPLVGWLTAWSFDRLRLWHATGLAPEAATRRALGVAGCRLAVLVVAAAGPRRRALPLLGLALLPSPVQVPRARRCRRRPPHPRDARPPGALATLRAPGAHDPRSTP